MVDKFVVVIQPSGVFQGWASPDAARAPLVFARARGREKINSYPHLQYFEYIFSKIIGHCPAIHVFLVTPLIQPPEKRLFFWSPCRTAHWHKTRRA